MFGLGGWELVVLAIIGLLIFGKRLPDVGRSLGKGIVEFKKGLSGIEEEVSKTGNASVAQQIQSTNQQAMQLENQRLEAELKLAREKLQQGQNSGGPPTGA